MERRIWRQTGAESSADNSSLLKQVRRTCTREWQLPVSKKGKSPSNVIKLLTYILRNSWQERNIHGKAKIKQKKKTFKNTYASTLDFVLLFEGPKLNQTRTHTSTSTNRWKKAPIWWMSISNTLQIEKQKLKRRWKNDHNN
jgi:hypothetical protein